MTALLEVEGLKTHFATPRGVVRAVDGVDFTLQVGETLGIVGESGCGKSVLARTLMGLLPRRPYTINAGHARFMQRDLLSMSEAQLREVRGRSIAMVFQDPLTSLNPVLPVSRQIVQVLQQHSDLGRKAAQDRAIELLEQVNIPAPRQRAYDYPHQLSGGMRQRVVIAIALACNPRLLIADEPTTALDVTVQAQILELLRSLQRQHRMALILITHNLGVVAGMCDRVAVMYAGRIVEQASVDALFATPRMRYTEALLRAMPRLDAPSHAPLHVIGGAPPSLLSTPPGCRFAPRCQYALPNCSSDEPPITAASEQQHYACWNPVSHARTSDGG
jgi:oligopeptide/dipeptide ABC transporter ATP-binding protein